MKRFLVVVLRSEAFAELWPRLAEVAEAELRLVDGGHGRPDVADALAVIVAAGGEEVAALTDLDALAGGSAPVAVVGAETDHRIIIALLHAGAGDYFALPGDLGDLRGWVAGEAERVSAEEKARVLVTEHRARYDFSQMIGRSPCFTSTLERAAKVIPNGSATILIQGETGTGKELLARAIHYNGPRGSGPLVELNCAALPDNLLESELFGYEAGAFTDARSAKPGLFEVASGGTLFLDEIGDLSAGLQGKLLRVLETGRIRRLGSVKDIRVDVRIIAATHVDLDHAVREGRFREDLLYRLNVLPISLPPLRSRQEDILLLAEHYAGEFRRLYSHPETPISPEVRDALLRHDWPGNIRELRNAIERAVVLGDGELSVEELLPPRSHHHDRSNGGLPFPAPLRQIEETAAEKMVALHGGNKTRAAVALGISRKYLYELLNGKENGDVAG